VKQFIKRVVVPEGRQLRKVRGGVAKGMLMELDLLSQAQRYWGFDEREILNPVLRLSSTCKSLVDVGANDGYYTMAFLRSHAERVVACEPGPSVNLLLRNAVANGYKPDERFSIVSKPIGSGVGCLSVADLVRDLPRPVFLKVDIEGGEADLLASAEACPFISELRWLIETHSRELERQCIAWLQSHGCKTKIIYNARWRILLPELRPIPHNRWLTAVPLAPELRITA
jgi:hypothetical protein